MTESKKINIVWASLALCYLIIRFGYTTELNMLGPYATNIFEALLIGLVVVSQFNKNLIFACFACLASGLVLFKMGILFGIPASSIASDFDNLLSFLVVAPLIEEGIFRFFLWQPILYISKRPKLTWLATSFLFSYMHLHALWSEPADLRLAIVYQGFYTLGLGLACGHFVLKYKSLVSAIALHITFNLGFFWASHIWTFSLN